MGAPHRARYFKEVLQKIAAKDDVVFWTGEQIFDWYTASGS